MPCNIELLPPSVATLELRRVCLGEEGGKEFFTFHPGVRSIESNESWGVDMSEPLWNGLSLVMGKDAGVLCTRLKSISVGANPSRTELASLDNCLRNRQATGFMLGHLETLGGYSDSVDDTNEGFAPLLEL